MTRTILLLAASCLGLLAYASDEFDFRSEDRPEYAKSVTIDELQSKQKETEITILDVRLIEDFEADPQLIPDALYRDPDEIEGWASSVPKDSKVVVYCVRGKWVSQKAADYLSKQGLDVYTLEGGIEAWKQTAE